MELDVLYAHIASPPVVAQFPALAQRIANKEIPHGADIIIGIHARLAKEPCRFKGSEEPPDSSNATKPVSAEQDVSTDDAFESKDE